MYLFRCKACALILGVVTLWELQAPGPQLCQWHSTEGWWDTGLTLGYCVVCHIGVLLPASRLSSPAL